MVLADLCPCIHHYSQSHYHSGAGNADAGLAESCQIHTQVFQVPLLFYHRLYSVADKLPGDATNEIPEKRTAKKACYPAHNSLYRRFYHSFIIYPLR